jgi:hypothetical protein
MNRDDVTRMAREAQMPFYWRTGEITYLDKLERFAALVASPEREACAGLRKEVALQGKHTVEYEEGFWDGLEKYEDLIKARGLT